MSARPTILIEGATVLPLDDAGRIREDTDVLVRDGRVAGLGPSGSFADAPVDKRIDGAAKCVMPGLVNAHTHSPAAFAKGTVDRDDHPRFMWRNQADTVGRTREEIHACTLLAALEMLRTGTTAVVDNYPEQPFEEADVEPVVAAYKEAGLRAAIALRVYDEPYYDILPRTGAALPRDLGERLEASPLAPRPAGEQLELCRRIVERWDEGPGGMIRIMVAPSAPLRCSDDFLRGVAGLARSHGVGVHTHLLETPVAVDICRARHGKSLVERMRDLDLLGPHVSCAHGIYVSEEDIALLAGSGTTIVHNPVSNLRIGDGVAPVVEMARAGVPLALGTDGPSTNDNLNLFEEVKLAAILHRTQGASRDRWIADREALAMGTVGGARALGLAGELGTVAEGARADLVLLDLDTPQFTPLNDVLRQIVYADCGRAVDTVIVDGRIVVEGGRAATIDEPALLSRARALRAASRARNAELYAFADALMPYLEPAE